MSGDDGEEGPRASGESFLKELRHGVDHAAGVERYEDTTQDQDDVAVQLPVSHRHTGRRAGTGKADDVFGADVRREDQGTDDDPSSVSPSKKVVGSGLLLHPHHVDDDPD